MERKSEIEILIKELKSKLTPKIEERQEFIIIANDVIQVKLLNHFFFTGGKPIIKVDFYDNVTQINVKAEETEKFGELSIYHPREKTSSRFVGQPMATEMSGFELTWFSSGASKDAIRNLFYLEVVGFVANQVRTDGELIQTLEKYIKEISVVNREIGKIEIEISGLNYEKQRIDREELEQKIISEGGVEFETPYNAFIRDTDTKKRGKGRSKIKKVLINGITNKTMTLDYYGIDGTIIDTLKLGKDHAVNLLVSHYDYKKTLYKSCK